MSTNGDKHRTNGLYFISVITGTVVSTNMSCVTCHECHVSSVKLAQCL